MKCIFCGQDTTNSKSVEHIIPESFGNSKKILRRGIVCDKCNNYFARKIEGPFLSKYPVLQLRKELDIKNKNGVVPKVDVFDGFIKEIKMNETYMVYSKQDLSESEIAKTVAKYKDYVKKQDEQLIQQDYQLSRLLAKIAVENFIDACGQSDEVCNDVINDKGFEPIREYVRYGGKNIWPYNARRIYSKNEAYHGDPFSAINWECDFLFTGRGEIYSVIALFGIEYAINIGGPFIDGYKYWLKRNHNESPLYISREKRARNYRAYSKKVYSKI